MHLFIQLSVSKKLVRKLYKREKGIRIFRTALNALPINRYLDNTPIKNTITIEQETKVHYMNASPISLPCTFSN